VSVAEINNALREAAGGALKGILSVTDEPLVSVDFNGSTFSSVADLGNTMVMGDKMAKVFSWYDNEMGFSHRMIDVARYLADKGF
jgi:glyceraldehyde 3-phosphate dehydrogenase